MVCETVDIVVQRWNGKVFLPFHNGILVTSVLDRAAAEGHRLELLRISV